MVEGVRRLGPAVLLVTAALALGTRPSPAAQATPAVWVPEPVPVGRAAVPPRGFLGQLRVRVLPEVLAAHVRPGDRVRLRLSAAVEIDAVLEAAASSGPARIIWRGRVAGESLSMVTLIADRVGIAGTVHFSGGSFAIRRLRRGSALVLESDPAMERPDRARIAPLTEPSTRDDLGDSPGLRGRIEIDVLALYTRAAANQVGGRRAIDADFEVAVANMQTALDRSGLPVRARLMAVRDADYAQRGNDQAYFERALNNLTIKRDGEMDQIHELRDLFGADVVVLAAEPNVDVCGLGWVTGGGNGLGANDDIWAFNVVSAECLTAFSGLTLAHEVGHNFGLNHNAEDRGGGNGAYSFSFGYRLPGAFRTVMAYRCDDDGLASCPQVPLFSSPGLSHEGQAAGTSEADNARSLLNDIMVYSHWRPCTKRCRIER